MRNVADPICVINNIKATVVPRKSERHPVEFYLPKGESWSRDFDWTDLGSLLITDESREKWLHNPPPVIVNIHYTDALGNRRERQQAFAPSLLPYEDFRPVGGDDLNFERNLPVPAGT